MFLDGVPGSETLEEDDDGRLIFNWKRWVGVTSGSSRGDFFRSLSIAQLNSNGILLELTQGCSADRALIRDILDVVESRAKQPTHLEKTRLDSFISGRTNFAGAIWALFYSEFRSAGTRFGAQDLSLLHEARQEAATFMSCARLSRHSFPTFLDTQHAQHEDDDQSGRCEDKGLLRSFKRGTTFSGASIQPCPWLDEAVIGNDLPYFLWDRHAHKTIQVDSLSSRPDYIAVSHTWGRWIIRDEATSLDGTPWPIPQNSRFRVADLPVILEGIPLDHRYVWMDLVCIPQDHSDLSRIEISRQAKIFQSASITVMWLHDIQGWSGLSTALEWLSLDFMIDNRFAKDINAARQRQMVLQQDSSQLELLISISQEESRIVSHMEMNPWFTSLWTLQEICLRPDMLLADSSWDLAKLNSEPISFDEILSFNVLSNFDKAATAPRSVDHLMALLINTGLKELLSITRARLLGLGAHRFCLERRAEAIMSALGATTWFSPSAQDMPIEDLVLDQYPLSFVNEALEKMGPVAFFTSSASGLWLQAKDRKIGPFGEYQRAGSMMPFGKNAPKLHLDLDGDEKAHPSLSTWTIDTDGGVNIGEAVIVSSTAMNATDVFQTTIYAPSRDGTLWLEEQLVDLHEWTRNFLPPGPNFAALLASGEMGPTGILLKELEPGIMVKIGNFLPDTEPVDFDAPDSHWNPPEAQSVGWLVL